MITVWACFLLKIENGKNEGRAFSPFLGKSDFLDTAVRREECTVLHPVRHGQTWLIPFVPESTSHGAQLRND